MSEKPSAIIITLRKLKADNALHPGRMAAIQLAIETIELQDQQLHAQREVIKNLRETIVHLNGDIGKLTTKE